MKALAYWWPFAMGRAIKYGLTNPVGGIRMVEGYLSNVSQYGDLAHRYFSNILTNLETTKYVDSEEAFLKTIMTWNPVDREEIRRMHRDFYEQDHKKSLKQALTIV